MIVLLDAGPLGMITNPRSSPENEDCKNWLASLAYKGIEVMIPEIADYEVRRELLRAGKERGLGRLDALRAMLGFAPITSPVMLRAAEFWATARKMGRQSADDASLDADMILAAQADLLRHGDETVIATTNVRHLTLFSSALIWREIG
ncbi:MAG: type II toxin-antitoxin system VapC family toxin [Bryobacteraceae bacterium]